MTASIAPVSKVTELENLVASVQGRIEKLAEKREIDFPQNYSVGNALRSAWLMIQETKDASGRLALDVCSKESVCNALFNTVVQGLNPAKKQIYYIVYGQQLQAQRSYFGALAAVKRLHEVKDAYADVVYKGDTFKVSKVRGSWRIDEHTSSFENINPDNIVAAYCVIERTDGGDYVEVMNMAQIQQAWCKSRTKGQGTHKEFPDQMAKKTVINRACKSFVNTSDDSDIFVEAFNQTGEAYKEESAHTHTQDARLQALNAELGASRQEAKAHAVDVSTEEVKDQPAPPVQEDNPSPDYVPAPKSGKEGEADGQLCIG